MTATQRFIGQPVGNPWMSSKVVSMYSTTSLALHGLSLISDVGMLMQQSDAVKIRLRYLMWSRLELRV